MNSLMVNKNDLRFSDDRFSYLAEASLNDLISEYQQISSSEVVEATTDT